MQFENETLAYCYNYLTGRTKLQKCEDLFDDLADMDTPNMMLLFSIPLLLSGLLMVCLAIFNYMTSLQFVLFFNKVALITGIIMLIGLFVYTIIAFLGSHIITLLEMILAPIMSKIRSNKLKLLQRYLLMCKLCSLQTVWFPKVLEKRKVKHPELGVPLTLLTIECNDDILQLYAATVPDRIRKLSFQHEFVSTIK